MSRLTVTFKKTYKITKLQCLHAVQCTVQWFLANGEQCSILETWIVDCVKNSNFLINIAVTGTLHKLQCSFFSLCKKRAVLRDLHTNTPSRPLWNHLFSFQTFPWEKKVPPTSRLSQWKTLITKKASPRPFLMPSETHSTLVQSMKFPLNFTLTQRQQSQISSHYFANTPKKGAFGVWFSHVRGCGKVFFFTPVFQNPTKTRWISKSILHIAKLNVKFEFCCEREGDAWWHSQKEHTKQTRNRHPARASATKYFFLTQDRWLIRHSHTPIRTRFVWQLLEKKEKKSSHQLIRILQQHTQRHATRRPFFTKTEQKNKLIFFQLYAIALSHLWFRCQNHRLNLHIYKILTILLRSQNLCRCEASEVAKNTKREKLKTLTHKRQCFLHPHQHTMKKKNTPTPHADTQRHTWRKTGGGNKKKKKKKRAEKGKKRPTCATASKIRETLKIWLESVWNPVSK